MNETTSWSRRDDRRLTEVSRALTYARSLDNVLSLAVDNAIQLLEAEKAVLMLGEGHDRLRIRAARGIPAETVERFAEPLDEALVTRLAAVFGEGSAERFLGVPLVLQGDVVGLLAVHRRQGGAVSEADEWLLSALADQTSVALQDARLAERLTRLETEVEALRMERSQKEEALQVMSHDLRSPLQAILGYLELLTGGALGDLTGRQRETVGRMRTICRHLAALLDSVVEMSRLTSGKARFDIRPIVARKSVREAFEIVGPAAQGAGVDLEVDSLPAGVVLADPHRLRQVLVHLLENAVKFAPAGSTVRVRIRSVSDAPESTAAIDIVDGGPGVPEEFRPHIFEPYHRRSGDSPRARAGLGLGLAIAKRVTEGMGGTLGLECPAEGGSVFTVRLREAAEDAAV